MPDARSPIRHHLVLYQRDPEQGRARFFSLVIERDLFGTIRLDDRHTRAWPGEAPVSAKPRLALRPTSFIFRSD